MKKTILVLLIALVAIGCVFAEGKDFGKIVVGVKAGYLPETKMAQFDVDGKWQLDFPAVAPFTTDVVVSCGVITNFKKAYIFDGYMGAGLTKSIGEHFDVYANCGLDVLFAKDYCELGVAAKTGVEYFPIEKLGVNVNLKATELIESRVVLFEPSIGVSYAF